MAPKEIRPWYWLLCLDPEETIIPNFEKILKEEFLKQTNLKSPILQVF